MVRAGWPRILHPSPGMTLWDPPLIHRFVQRLFVSHMTLSGWRVHWPVWAVQGREPVYLQCATATQVCTIITLILHPLVFCQNMFLYVMFARVALHC